jgi:hypothetical protein
MLPFVILGIIHCFGASTFVSAQQLKVARHAQAQISTIEAETALDQGSKVLQAKDGPGDTACNVTFSLAGQITVFDDPIPSEIDTPEDFVRICSSPGYVHVVNIINTCDGLTLPGIRGCSETPGKCIVVVRMINTVPTDKEGLLWAHEFGHTKGLPHRSDETALMNPYLGPTERQVNTVECSAFNGHAQGANSSGHVGSKPTIEEFVHRDYVEGIPFDLASSYGHEDAKKLIAMLDDAEQKSYLTNIVVTLGMIGDPIAVQPLRTFIEKGDGRVDPQTIRAKSSALVAMGYIVNKQNDQEAFAYLVQGLSPKNWNDKNLKWNIADARSPEQKSINLAKASALGLGIAGTPDAATALTSAEFSIQSVDPAAQPGITQVIKHALAINKTIQKEGLMKYHLAVQKPM